MTNLEWQVSTAHRLLQHVENRTTDVARGQRWLETRSYSDPDIWKLEMDTVFRRGPFGAALSCELPGPNTFKTLDVLNVPVLLTRDDQGKAHAFMNVCRHRGASVAVNTCGHASRFTCPYHAWTYSNDGRLITISEKETFGPVDLDAHGLTRLPLEERFGLLFLGLTPGTDLAIDDHLAGFEPHLEALHLEPRHVIREDLFDVPNWKLVMEGFVDPYHFAILHRDTLGKFTYGNIVAIDRVGPHMALTFAGKSITELRTVPEAEWRPLDDYHTSVELSIFPNISLTRMTTTVILQVVLPGNTPDRSKATQVFAVTDATLKDADALADTKSQAEFICDVMKEEDYPISWVLQKNSTSGAQAQIRFGRNEAAPQYFHEALDRAISDKARSKV